MPEQSRIRQERNKRFSQSLQERYYINKQRETPEYKEWQENESSWIVKQLLSNERTIAELRHKLKFHVPSDAAKMIESYLTQPTKALFYQMESVIAFVRTMKEEIAEIKREKQSYTYEQHQERIRQIFYNTKHDPSRKPIPTIAWEFYSQKRKTNNENVIFGQRYINWRTRQLQALLTQNEPVFDAEKFTHADPAQFIATWREKLNRQNIESASVRNVYNLYAQNKEEWFSVNFEYWENYELDLKRYNEKINAYFYVVQDLSTFIRRYSPLFEITESIEFELWNNFITEFNQIQEALDSEPYRREYAEGYGEYQTFIRNKEKVWSLRVVEPEPEESEESTESENADVDENTEAEGETNE